MNTLRFLAGASMLAMAAAAWAGPQAIEAASGLPQVGALDGRGAAWRYTTVRANLPYQAKLEVDVPACIGSWGDARRGAVGSQQRACGDGQAGTAPAHLNQELRLSWRAPRFTASLPDLVFTASAWRVPGEGHGLAADLELTQAVGPVRLFAGHSVPLRARAPGEAWHSNYGGLKWRPSAGESFDLGFDDSHTADGRERDRSISARYSHTLSAAARWRVSLTRHLDDTRRPWTAGMGGDWKF